MTITYWFSMLALAYSAIGFAAAQGKQLIVVIINVWEYMYTYTVCVYVYTSIQIISSRGLIGYSK